MIPLEIRTIMQDCLSQSDRMLLTGAIHEGLLCWVIDPTPLKDLIPPGTQLTAWLGGPYESPDSPWFPIAQAVAIAVVGDSGLGTPMCEAVNGLLLADSPDIAAFDTLLANTEVALVTAGMSYLLVRTLLDTQLLDADTELPLRLEIVKQVRAVLTDPQYDVGHTLDRSDGELIAECIALFGLSLNDAHPSYRLDCLVLKALNASLPTGTLA